jgi:hypothetical protein
MYTVYTIVFLPFLQFSYIYRNGIPYKYLNKSKILPKIQLDYILESLYI